MINTNKKYKTRGGHEVRIYATDGGGYYPVHGAVFEDGVWRALVWPSDGKCKHAHIDSWYTLVEVKPRIHREVWVNVFRLPNESEYIHTYNTKADADRDSVPIVNGTRVACVKIVIDCEEGEGL